MSLSGYSLPRTPEGRSSLVPAPPWHYVGDMLVVEYWADPAAATAALPDAVEPFGPDPGRAAALFVDWRSCTDEGAELSDPARSQYKECFIVLNGFYEGRHVTTCPAIWVDRDFALARGWIQGFPKKLGSIWITRTFGLACKADPGLAAGSVFAATLAANDRRLIEASVSLQRVSDAGPGHNAPPLLNTRYFPRLAQGQHDQPAVHELVAARSHSRVVSTAWEGSATLRFFAAPNEEHASLGPIRVGAGYRLSFAYTVDDLETLRDLR
jgi:Acetoacetate decarboxylase (ADC)